MIGGPSLLTSMYAMGYFDLSGKSSPGLEWG